MSRSMSNSSLSTNLSIPLTQAHMYFSLPVQQPCVFHMIVSTTDTAFNAACLAEFVHLTPFQAAQQTAYLAWHVANTITILTDVMNAG